MNALDPAILPADRRARERHDVQQLIMNAARELFVRHGYERVTMRQIADAIAYTPGALYVHFKDKRDLMLALCRHDFAQFDAHLVSLLHDEPCPLRRICRMGRTYLQFAQAHPRQYELMFMVKPPDDPRLQPTPEDLAALQDPEKNGYAFLVQCVAQAQAQGLLRADVTDAQIAAQTLWAGMHGVAAVYITFEGGCEHKLMAPYEDAGRMMRRTLMLGLVRDTSRVDELFAQELADPAGGAP